MIAISGVQKTYGGRTVLDVPSLTLHDGGRYALIGANGSGKSTLLRILAGQLSPDCGCISYGGMPAREIGFLPQQPYAFDKTVLQNVLLSVRGLPNAKTRALAAIDRVGLGALSGARGNRLSGGETQRMALARMLVRPWKLLLLDEPTSATDILANDLIEGALLRYAEETGCTLVFSSHAPGQAKRLGTQVVVLDAGAVVEAGDAATVLHAPQTPQAQRFLRHWVL